MAQLGTGVSSSDVVPRLYEHLSKIGTTKKLDLVLHTFGGDLLAPTAIVDALREFCSELAVLVPHYAMSAGTMIALGANEIVMGPIARLGPVDPSVTNVFNPETTVEVEDAKGKKTKKTEKLNISVEDVAAYFALMRDRAKLDTAGMAVAVKALTDQVHPLALGNVHRKYELIRSVSKRLLAHHMDAEKDREKIEAIVTILTEKLYDHLYQISRHEAKNVIGLSIAAPSLPLETAMWNLYQRYRAALHLDGLDHLSGPFVLDSGIIESGDLTDAFVLEGVATKKASGLDVALAKAGWNSV